MLQKIVNFKSFKIALMTILLTSCGFAFSCGPEVGIPEGEIPEEITP